MMLIDLARFAAEHSAYGIALVAILIGICFAAKATKEGL